MQSSLEKLSSGQRINKASDDAAGLAISESLRAKITGMDQAKRNANDAVSMIQIAEGGMNEMGNILNRLRELTVQASSDTIGNQERGFLNREYVQLVDEIDRIAATTEFNGLKFFDTDRTEYVIQVGVNASKPSENKDTISLDLSGLKFTSADLNLGKGSEIGPLTTSSTAPSRENIAANLEKIDDVIVKLSGERANLGALQSRLNSTINNLGVSIENSSAARSRIVDTDFAAETTKLTQNKILSAASVAVLAQSNAVPEMALQLLR
jgi:flagellin